MSKAKFAAAKELIDEKKYDEARGILKTIDHPTARQWEAKIDRIESDASLNPPEPASFAKSSTKKAASKKSPKQAPAKGRGMIFKVGVGCLGIFIAIIILGALLSKGATDTLVALEATPTSRPDVRDTPTTSSGVTIIPTTVRASNGFVTATPAAGTIYPTATITDTPQPTITNTDLPTQTPAPQITPVAGDLYDVIGTANARSCPASTCELIGKLDSGSVIAVTGIASGENYKNSPLWMQTVYHDGRTVYIHSSLVTPHRDYVQPTDAPVVQQQAPPAQASSGTIICNDGYVWPGTTRQGACHGYHGIAN